MDSKKPQQTFSREKDEYESSKKGVQREMATDAPITTLSVSRNYQKYLSFISCKYLAQFYGRENREVQSSVE